MSSPSTFVRCALLAALAAFSAPEESNAQWYGYSTYYAPSYSYGVYPRTYRQAVRWNRRAFRQSYSYGYPYYSAGTYTVGYYGSVGGGSACCGSCGVTTYYAPSCGCDCSYSCNSCNTCGYACNTCSSCSSCSSGNCPSGNCSANYSSDTVVNSVPSDVDEKQPTPVKPKSQETFENGSGFRPTDDFKSNNSGSGTGRYDDMNFDPPKTDINREPLVPNTLEPLAPGADDFLPEAGGSGTESFKPIDDDSAALPEEFLVPAVSVARARTQVRARYQAPRRVARNFAIEQISPVSDTQLAIAD